MRQGQIYRIRPVSYAVSSRSVGIGARSYPRPYNTPFDCFRYGEVESKHHDAALHLSFDRVLKQRRTHTSILSVVPLSGRGRGPHRNSRQCGGRKRGCFHLIVMIQQSPSLCRDHTVQGFRRRLGVLDGERRYTKCRAT